MSTDPSTTITSGDGQALPASPPLNRDYSPSPSASPTPGLLACPPLDRCFSTNSSNSDYSRLSSGSRSSSGSAATAAAAAAASARRRGYVRPEGARFADSARSRDSVMSLGSIAHLQYYFARTGVLDGKGAQLAREDAHAKKRRSTQEAGSVVIADTTQPPELVSPTNAGSEISQSPLEEYDPNVHEWDDPFMLPPTVSTYNHRNQYVPPPPDINVLREELKISLGHVSNALADLKQSDEVQRETLPHRADPQEPEPPEEDGDDPGQRSPNRGWHEIQGTHILDVVTLAIKAAREYYLMHDHPQLLSKVKSERQLREELLGVMDVLKRMALRNFAGGVRNEEIDSMRQWVGTVEAFLVKEKEVEEQEKRDRESWTWLDGNWLGQERRREWEFMKTFVAEGEELPQWDDPLTTPELPTPFLCAFSNGLTLVHLHNRILKKSKRQYARIDAYHTDFAVPYRAADNLRYWVKAAEIRWEIKLQVDVMSIVYNKERDAWIDFDTAVQQWCKAVREEITKEWKTGNVQVSLPELRYD